MKIFAVVALLVGIGAVPALVQGQQFNFTYTSATENATGTLFGTEIGSTGDYQITSGTITITGSAFSGTGSIDTNPGDLGTFGADDILYLVGDAPSPHVAGRILSWGGLLFSTTNGLNNMWGGDNNGYGLITAYSLSGNNGNYIDYPGTLTVSEVPDGGTTLALLGLAVAGLAGLRRKLSK